MRHTFSLVACGKLHGTPQPPRLSHKGKVDGTRSTSLLGQAPRNIMLLDLICSLLNWTPMQVLLSLPEEKCLVHIVLGQYMHEGMCGRNNGQRRI